MLQELLSVEPDMFAEGIKILLEDKIILLVGIFMLLGATIIMLEGAMLPTGIEVFH